MNVTMVHMTVRDKLLVLTYLAPTDALAEMVGPVMGKAAQVSNHF